MLSLPRTDRGTPEVVMKNIGGEIDSSSLRASYERKVGIKVTEKCVLEEITSCFLKDNKGGHGRCSSNLVSIFDIFEQKK